MLQRLLRKPTKSTTLAKLLEGWGWMGTRTWATTKAGEAARDAMVAMNKTRVVPVVTLGPATVGAPVTMRAHAGNLGGGLETEEAGVCDRHAAAMGIVVC